MEHRSVSTFVVRKDVLNVYVETVVMKDEEEYKDYLVDKAKEMLNEDLSGAGEQEKPQMKSKTSEMDEKAEKDSTSKIPYSWDPHEIKHLVENRKSMSNEEMEEFLKKDSEFHEKLEDVDEWNGFSRWEERFLLQNHQTMNIEDMSDQLERDEKEIGLKLHMMGLEPFEG